MPSVALVSYGRRAMSHVVEASTADKTVRFVRLYGLNVPVRAWLALESVSVYWDRQTSWGGP